MDELGKDARPWVKLSLDYFDNPKIDGLSDTAQLLHLQLILRTARQQMDGEVSARAAKSRGEAAFKELVSAGLLDKVDARTYRIHDYLKHQTLSKTIEQRKRAGGRGGHSKNHVKRFIYDDACSFCQDDAAGALEWLKDPRVTAKTP